MIKNTHNVLQNKIIPAADGSYNLDFNINLNEINKLKILVKTEGEMPDGFKVTAILNSELFGEIERQVQSHTSIVNNSYFMKDIFFENYYLYDTITIKFKIPYASLLTPSGTNNTYKITLIVYTINEEDTEGYEPFYVRIGP